MPEEESFRRIVYASRSTAMASRDRDAIFAASLRNNGVDGVTGILWTEGEHYLQLLEGPPESVEAAYQRILKDSRHHEITVLENGSAAERQFGDWDMAGLQPDETALAIEKLRGLLSGAPDKITAHFPGLR